MKNERKWDVISLWLEGNLSDSEKADFEEIKEAAAHDIKFASEIWYNSGKLRSFQEPNVELAIANMKAKLGFKEDSRPVQQKFVRKFSVARYAVAASLAGILAFVAFTLLRSTDYEKLTASASFYTLPDESKISVEEGTVSYRKGLNGETREVSLKGKATFEVEKEKTGRPFVVKTERTTTHVLGTKFILSERKELTSLSVLEGKVRFSAMGQSFVVVADEAAQFDGVKLVFTKANDMVFKDQSIESIAESLGEKLGILIAFTSDEQKNTRLNLTINPTLDRRKIAMLLSEVSGFIFEIKSDKWICKNS